MKRYYVCDIIGTGSELDPYRPAVWPSVSTAAPNHVAVYPPQDPTTGRYTGTTCLVLVSGNDHARISALAGVDSLPDVSLDVEYGAVDRTKRNAAENSLKRRSLTVPQLVTGDGYRTFIRGIGRQLDGNFAEDNFDVAE